MYRPLFRQVALASALALLAGCGLTATDGPAAESVAVPLLLADDLSADAAPAVGQAAMLAADFRFVTSDSPTYSAFTDDCLRRLDSLFAAGGTVVVESEVRFHPPGQPDAVSDVVRVVGPATASHRVRREDRVRFAVRIEALRPGRAVGVAHVRAVADKGTPREAQLGTGVEFECFEVAEGAGRALGDCVSSSAPR